MEPGDIVKRKGEEAYGVVHYSTFGISIHIWHPQYNALGKTLGDTPSSYEKYWEVVKELPSNWKIGPHGCPIKETS